MDITDYIPIGHNHAISRKSLCMSTGLSDRRVRLCIHQARRNTAILNVQEGDGYFIPDESDKTDMELLERYINQETHRLKSVGWSLMGARKLQREHGEKEDGNL